MIEGKLVNRNYTDKDGIKRYSTEVQATELLIISKNNKALSFLSYTVPAFLRALF